MADTKSESLTRFGEAAGFSQRMLLIYDGIHYDPLYLEPAGGGRPVTTFAASDNSVLEMAREVAREARKQHNYTDTAGFALKCLVCGAKLKGETEAQAHAQDTGHINFSEF